MLYLVWSIRMLSQPTKVLLSAEYKQKYEALYADLRGSASALSITTIHNIRLLVLISALVLAPAHPTFQSGIFAVSSAISLGWDAALQPYQGVLLTAQTLFMDVAKLLGGLGFVVLTIPGVPMEMVRRVCTYVAVVLAGAMGGGLVLALAQQAIGIYVWVKEMCRRRNPETIYGVANTDMSQIAAGADPEKKMHHQQAGSSSSLCK